LHIHSSIVAQAMVRKSLAVLLSGTLILSGCGSTPLTTYPTAAAVLPTTSAQAIKHVVVIFGENISFDPYFGSYPNAANLPGETKFTAAAGAPTNISNYTTTPALLTDKSNTSVANGAGATNPYRLDPSQAGTADQDHNYRPEQTAFDGGKMDMFLLSVGTADTPALASATGASSISATTGLTMGYFDGNTVTALSNYAQHYSLNDHSFGTTFGASTPGALNVCALKAIRASISTTATFWSTSRMT
jgi:phospholipase C